MWLIALQARPIHGMRWEPYCLCLLTLPFPNLIDRAHTRASSRHLNVALITGQPPYIARSFALLSHHQREFHGLRRPRDDLIARSLSNRGRGRRGHRPCATSYSPEVRTLWCCYCCGGSDEPSYVCVAHHKSQRVKPELERESQCTSNRVPTRLSKFIRD